MYEDIKPIFQTAKLRYDLIASKTFFDFFYIFY